MAALPPTRSNSPRPSESRLERKTSSSAYSHAHHRKASIVNGIPHSRSASYVVGMSGGSSMSPQLGTTREQITIPAMPQSPTASVITLNPPPTIGSATTISASSYSVGAASSYAAAITGSSYTVGAGSNYTAGTGSTYTVGVASSFAERPPYHQHQNSRSTSRSHQHSHSHHHHPVEPRTTSEYALHILFTQVRAIQLWYYARALLLTPNSLCVLQSVKSMPVCHQTTGWIQSRWSIISLARE